jgi:hypothetical protein
LDKSQIISNCATHVLPGCANLGNEKKRQIKMHFKRLELLMLVVLIFSVRYYLQAWYAEFLLEIGLKILRRKTGARLNFFFAYNLALLLIELPKDQHPTA